MEAQAQPAPRTSPFWSTAAVFGALWGTVEITLGSFLHTLKIPFSGAVLASIGAALLVAERQVASRRGLSVATALIAALCKSLSPGGVILGPMLGISVEGLLVELALLASPRFLGSAVLAGTLAAVWALFQKVDYAFLYKSTAEDHHLKFLELPPGINLAKPELAAKYAEASVEVKMKSGPTVLKGHPITYGITIPTNGSAPDEAARFLAFLLGARGRQIQLAAGFHPLGHAVASGAGVPSALQQGVVRP